MISPNRARVTVSLLSLLPAPYRAGPGVISDPDKKHEDGEEVLRDVKPSIQEV